MSPQSSRLSVVEVSTTFGIGPGRERTEPHLERLWAAGAVERRGAEVQRTLFLIARADATVVCGWEGDVLRADAALAGNGYIVAVDVPAGEGNALYVFGVQICGGAVANEEVGEGRARDGSQEEDVRELHFWAVRRR